MKKLLAFLGTVLVLPLGIGLVYALLTNTAALVAFVAILMFIFGALTTMVFALALNRQWTNGLFGQQQPRISNNYRLPAYPPYQPQDQQYLPEPQPTFEIIQPAGQVADDEPVA